MRREDLPGGGVRLGVTAPDAPRLRVEVTGGDRFRVSQDGRPVLLARVGDGNYGVHYTRLPGHEPVLPPITADLARARPAWPHRYATWLACGPGPLHTGWWALQPWRAAHPRAVWEHELASGPSGYLDWFAGWNGVVAARDLPGPDDGRVKAHRKLAREGALPPLLLWWVSGLDGWLLLDGHARLAAALAEDVTPPALELARAPSPDEIEERVGHASGNDALAPGKASHFAGVYADIPGERERTRVWPGHSQ
ncbi:hypothetical protein [Spirillospora sp. CA-294931]|uniref:hypothetical protein n=1 Tax=Spirillospora sp. CA-294931 TaxID=3240042 RepID=UPI003D8E5149